MTTDIVEKHFHTIISHTMVCYRTSWDLEWKVFCFLAGGTFLFTVQIRRYLLRWYFTSRKRYIDSFYRSSPFTIQDVASHSVFQISFARYSLQSRAKQATEKRRAQETERSMFCFLSFWHINFSFSFLRSTTTFLKIRAFEAKKIVYRQCKRRLKAMRTFRPF